MDLFQLYLFISILSASIYTVSVFRDMLLCREVDITELLIGFLGVAATWPLLLVCGIIERVEDKLNRR